MELLTSLHFTNDAYRLEYCFSDRLLVWAVFSAETVCIQLREITILEFPRVFCRKSSLPYQARGSRAGAVRCPLRSKTSYIT